MNAPVRTLDASLLARAAPTGSMRYFAWLYTPAAQRDIMAALLLIETELHDSARAPHEVAHVRLQWWREEVERLIATRAQHPATQILQAHHSAKIDVDRLQTMVLAAAQELANSTYETDAELTQYFNNGSGALFMLAAQYLSDAPPSPTTLDAAQQLGAFVRRAEVARDVRQDVHHGRLFLPLTQLETAQIEYQHLQNSEWPAAFKQWLQHRSQQQLDAYRELRRTVVAAGDNGLRPLLVLSDLHARILQKIISDPAQAAQRRIDLGALEKPWIAWRAARTLR